MTPNVTWLKYDQHAAISEMNEHKKNAENYGLFF